MFFHLETDKRLSDFIVLRNAETIDISPVVRISMAFDTGSVTGIAFHRRHMTGRRIIPDHKPDMIDIIIVVPVEINHITGFGYIPVSLI